MDNNIRLKKFLERIKGEFAFDAAAIRIKDPVGYIPFATYDGLSGSFFEDECMIDVNDDCICGKVSRADIKTEKPFYTEKGSFWSNSLKEEIVEELIKSGIKPRIRCLQELYKTVLITPIKTSNTVGGILFLASREENMLTQEDVDFIENKTNLLGKVFTAMSECEKYNIITRLLAGNKGEDKGKFGRYLDHMNNCPSCHAFHSHRVELDDLIRQTMVLPNPPRDLKLRVIEKLG